MLADYDKRANMILDTDNHYKFDWVYGGNYYWEVINACDTQFFYELEPMPGALALWESTKHLNPTILTALPKTNGERVALQKRQWVAEWLGRDVPVITCTTREKPNYCNTGDVLIDDRAINRAAWRERGGVYILHKSAVQTWEVLKTMGYI